MKIRTIAPAVVDFALVPGGEITEPAAYAAFWRSLDTPGVEWTHTADTATVERYQTLATDSLQRPLHLALLEPTPDAVARLAEDAEPRHSGLAADCRAALAGLQIRVCDHHIALVEATFDVAALAPGDVPDVERAQAEAIRLTGEIARLVLAETLDPAVRAAREADDDGRFVADPEEPAGAVAAGAVLWVSRALVLDRDDPAARASLTVWLRDAGLGDEIVDDLLTGRRDHAARWLNYAFLTPDADAAMTASTPAGDAWQALRYAQYFYAALDLTDRNLAQILAQSSADRALGRLGELNQRLSALAHRAERIIMQRHDVSKYLKRSTRTEMDAILHGWEHHDLVEEPVRYKVELCHRRLAELTERRQARSSLFTDMILLGIGVTSVLSTALAFSEFGRASATDPSQAGYDVRGSSITDWVAAQPADAILLASAAVSLLLVVLFVLFRRRITP